jgi:hypothetical protein
MSNKQLRNILRVVHLVAGVMLIAFVYSDTLQASASFITLIRVVVPVVGISGIAMWQQASLSRLRRRLTTKADQVSVEVG